MAAVNPSGRGINIKLEVLNDLASRFLNEEKRDSIKLCSSIELAHWYYLDLMRPEDPTLPACNLKEFMRTLFLYFPWLLKDSATKDLDQLISEWKAHKFKKPVRGAIILNQDNTKCVLVQGYPSGTSWGFPKGKLEEGEADVDAAVREVYEETGFDIRALIQENWFLDASVHDSHARMYLILGVPEDTIFQPKTRNEIRNIKWFSIKDLPSYKRDKSSWQALGKSSNNFFMIIPFIGQLRKWLQNNRKRSRTKGISASFQPAQAPNQNQSKAQFHAQAPNESPQLLGSTNLNMSRSQSSPSQVTMVTKLPATTTTPPIGVSRSVTAPLLPTPVSYLNERRSPRPLLSSVTPPQHHLPHTPLITSVTPPQHRPPRPPLISMAPPQPHIPLAPSMTSPQPHPPLIPSMTLPQHHLPHPQTIAPPLLSILPSPRNHPILPSSTPGLLPTPPQQQHYSNGSCHGNSSAPPLLWHQRPPYQQQMPLPLPPHPPSHAPQPTPPPPQGVKRGQSSQVKVENNAFAPVPTKHWMPAKHWTLFKFDKEAIINKYCNNV